MTWDMDQLKSRFVAAQDEGQMGKLRLELVLERDRLLQDALVHKSKYDSIHDAIDRIDEVLLRIDEADEGGSR